jgi:hypothetical protein
MEHHNEVFHRARDDRACPGEARGLTGASVRMDGGEIKGIKGTVTTTLTPSDEAEGQCGAPEWALKI